MAAIADIATHHPTMLYTNVDHGDGHAHIGLEIPVPGSQITIAGQ